MLGVLLALLICGVGAARVTAGGPGHAAFIGHMQGFYITNFPLPAHEITVELWTKLMPLSETSAGAWFSYVVTDVDGTLYEDHFSMSHIALCHDSCVPFPPNAVDVDDGTWHHLALTWQLTTDATLYIDGVFVCTLTIPEAPHPLIPGGMLVLGQDTGLFDSLSGDGFSTSQPPQGQIDNFRIWAAVRSQADVVASMYTAIDGDFALSLQPELVASFTFDDALTIESYAVGGQNSPKIVSYHDALGNVLMGGCLNCTSIDAGILPVWAVSNCPAWRVNASAFVQVSEPSMRTIVPLSFSVELPCDGDVFAHGEVSVTITELPQSGSLWLLDNETQVVDGSILIDLFNGSRTVVLNQSANECALLGAALLLYQSPSVMTDVINGDERFVYTVAFTNSTSGQTYNSDVSVVEVVFDAPVVLLPQDNLAVRIGKSNPISVGVVDPGGDLPIGLVITELPMLGRLWQSDLTYIHKENTAVVDPLGRVLYDPGTYIRGENVDAMSFVFASGSRPLSQIFHLTQSRNGSELRSVWEFVEEWWAPFALDCGGRHNPLSSGCAELHPLSPLSSVQFDIPAVNLLPVSHGYGVKITEASSLDFELRSTKASFENWDSVFHDVNSVLPDPRRFLATVWAQPSGLVPTSNCTIRALYGWCDDSHTKLCEKIRGSIEVGGGHLWSVLRLRCNASSTANVTAIPLPDAFVAHTLANTWSLFSLEWDAALTRVCVYVNGQKVQCAGLTTPCDALNDTSNAAVTVVGGHRIVFGSRLYGQGVVTADDVPEGTEAITQLDHVAVLLDDIRLYQIVSDAQRVDVFQRSREPVQAAHQRSLPSGAQLLASVAFDSPFGMLWQPSFLTDAFPEWFPFPGSVATPRVDLAKAIAERQLTSAGLNHGFTYNRSVALVPISKPFGSLPLLEASVAPSQNEFSCVENGGVTFQLQGIELDNQLLIARITSFPAHGTLYDVNADGSVGEPVPTLSTPQSERVVVQWVNKVVGFSAEWASSADFLTSINVTMDQVDNREFTQDVFGACYCALGLIGPADCPQVNGDCPYTWTSPFNDGVDSVDVQFEQAVYVSQVEVYIPFGGQKTTAILAWNNVTASWVDIFSATSCEVEVALSPAKVLDYTIFRANPCRTTFATDTLRLVFDASLTVQWLEVDAVKLYGTLGRPAGTVANLDRLVHYKPKPHVFGVDTFAYLVSDCAFKDDRISASVGVSVSIAGADDVPFVSSTTFSVQDDSTSLFTVTIDCIDQHSGIGDATWPANHALVIHSLPLLGNLSAVIDGDTIMLTESMLPVTLPGSAVPLKFTPTEDALLRLQLCFGSDYFNVSARNLAMPQPSSDSPQSSVELTLSCNKVLCGPGQQLAQASRADVCILCAAGTYNLDPQAQCKTCPEGAVCNGGSHLAAAAGYWFHNETFYKCEEDRCCVEGNCNVTYGNQCTGGRAGLLCSRCAHPDYVAWGKTCKFCNEVGILPLILIILSAFIIVGVFLLNDYNDIHSRFKQYIDYNQLLDVVVSSRNRYPMYYVEKMGLLSLFSFNISSVSKSYELPCLAPLRGIGKFLAQSYSMPFGLGAVLLVCFAVIYARQKYRMRDFDSTQFYQALWQIILLCYTSVNAAGMSLINCKSVAGERVLVSEDSVFCSGQTYFVSMIVGLIVSILISVALPAYIVWSHARHKLVYWHVGKTLEASDEVAKLGDSVAPLCESPVKVSNNPAFRSPAGVTHSSADDAVMAALAGCGSPPKVCGVVADDGTDDHPNFSTTKSSSLATTATSRWIVSSPAVGRPPQSHLTLSKSNVQSGSSESSQEATSEAEQSHPQPQLHITHSRLFQAATPRLPTGVPGRSVLPVSPSAQQLGSFRTNALLSLSGDDSDLGGIAGAGKQDTLRVTEPVYVGTLLPPQFRRLNSHRSGAGLIRVASRAPGELVMPGEPQEKKRRSLRAFSPRSAVPGMDTLEPNATPLEVSYVDGVPMVGLPIPTEEALREQSGEPGFLEQLYMRLVKAQQENAQVEVNKVSRYSLGEALVQRTRMYKDSVRWWYEAYFLSRRTLFILLSVVLHSDDLRRTQLTFFVSMLALLFQCKVMPYRISDANMREIAMLTFLSIAAGYELLRVSAVANAIENTSIPDVIVTMLTLLGLSWIAFYVLRAGRNKARKLVKTVRTRLQRRSAVTAPEPAAVQRSGSTLFQRRASLMK